MNLVSIHLLIFREVRGQMQIKYSGALNISFEQFIYGKGFGKKTSFFNHSIWEFEITKYFVILQDLIYEYDLLSNILSSALANLLYAIRYFKILPHQSKQLSVYIVPVYSNLHDSCFLKYEHQTKTTLCTKLLLYLFALIS